MARSDTTCYDMTQCGATRYDMKQYNTTRYGISQYDTTRYGISQYDATRYSIARYDATHYDTANRNKQNHVSAFTHFPLFRFRAFSARIQRARFTFRSRLDGAGRCYLLRRQ